MSGSSLSPNPGTLGVCVHDVGEDSPRNSMIMVWQFFSRKNIIFQSVHDTDASTPVVAQKRTRVLKQAKLGQQNSL